MRKCLWTLLVALLLTSCSEGNAYAEKIIDLCETALDDFHDAETLEELENRNRELKEAHAQAEKDLQESRQALTDAITAFDEDSYQLYLEMLAAESRAQFAYQKRNAELSEKK